MELTGKCREEFEKWYFKDFEFNEEINDFDRRITLSIFYTEKNSMQYGVYVDFFDSVELFIQIETRIFDKEHPCYIYSKTVYNRVGCFNTRQEARTEAIKKADELRNEVLNK